MTAGNYDINCTAGEPLSVSISIVNPDTTGALLTYWSVRMHVRELQYSDTTMIELTTDNGRITKDIANGRIILNLTAEETSTLTTNGVYDIELYSTGGKSGVMRLLKGNFYVV
jgi:hypothetical protein